MTKKILIGQEELKNLRDRFKYSKELEDGNILFFPKMPFEFPKEHIDFLLEQKQKSTAVHKNIAYKPNQDKVTNHNTKDLVAAEKLREILHGYCQKVTNFLKTILPPYADGWKIDYGSFRPFEERGRKLRVRARNDLLHVDAFPTRPLHGSRILRFFTNINPKENRQWVTSYGFEKLAEKFSEKLPVPSSVSYDLKSRLERKIKKMLKMMGIKMIMRSPYDHFMLRMHHFMKEDKEFQRTCKKDHWEFPPFSCWAVFTDEVSHAALAGQYALEQTFIIPQKVLLCPEKSPVCILQRISGKNLIDTEFLKDALKT